MYGMPMSPGMNMSSSSSMDMIMHMTFYWGKDAVILFSGWPKDNLAMYILALLFVFVIAAGVDILSVSPAAAKLISSKPLAVALIQASVYAVRMCLAYMVMLSVMSYNLGIFIAAVAGHSVAVFFIKFRALSAVNPPADSGPKV